MGIIESQMPATAQNPASNRTRKTGVDQVIRALEDYCSGLEPGTRIPTRTELMRQFDASERAVLKALDELRRNGRIVLRNGSGTFVAEPQTGRGAESLVPQTLVDSRTVVAIAKPDRSVFDRAMNLLCNFTEDKGLALTCRLLSSSSPSLQVTEGGEKPLGYILFRQDLSPLARSLQERGNRVVLVGAPLVDDLPGVPNVYGDHETGGYIATRHMLDLGHRSIAFLGDDDLLQTRRWKGSMRACDEGRKRGQKIDAQVLNFNDVAAWSGRPEVIRNFFRSSGAPTAVVGWNDHEAVGLLGQMMRAGIRVPEEVSIIGYDDLPEGRLIHPTLSTVDTSIEQQLRTALDILTRPTPPASNHSVLVLPTLIRRDSSTPIAA